MIAFDTNVLIRLLVQDDPRQGAVAERILASALEAGEACFLSDAVLCEVEWVLESCYSATRADVLAAFQDLLARKIFLFTDRAVLRRALDAYQAGRADFSDYLIGARAQARGAATTYTFDRGLRGQAGFTFLDTR